MSYKRNLGGNSSCWTCLCYMLRDSSGTLVAVRVCCGMALKCRQILDPQRGQNCFPCLVSTTTLTGAMWGLTRGGERFQRQVRGEEKRPLNPPAPSTALLHVRYPQRSARAPALGSSCSQTSWRNFIPWSLSRARENGTFHGRTSNAVRIGDLVASTPDTSSACAAGHSELLAGRRRVQEPQGIFLYFHDCVFCSVRFVRSHVLLSYSLSNAHRAIHTAQRAALLQSGSPPLWLMPIRYVKCTGGTVEQYTIFTDSSMWGDIISDPSIFISTFSFLRKCCSRPCLGEHLPVVEHNAFFRMLSTQDHLRVRVV